MSVVVNHPFPHQHPSPNLPTPKHSHSSHDPVVHVASLMVGNVLLSVVMLQL